MPESYLRDPEVFPEKEGFGSIYVEAADKVTLKKVRDITFINALDILGIIYSSKSGNTKLRWRQLRGTAGKVVGEASANSLVNLITSGVITEEYARELVESGQSTQPSEKQATVEEAENSAYEQEASATSETPPAEDSPRITGDG